AEFSLDEREMRKGRFILLDIQRTSPPTEYPHGVINSSYAHHSCFDTDGEDSKKDDGHHRFGKPAYGLHAGPVMLLVGTRQLHNKCASHVRGEPVHQQGRQRKTQSTNSASMMGTVFLGLGLLWRWSGLLDGFWTSDEASFEQNPLVCTSSRHRK
ncbi:hypothetical protein IRJ41_024782, partial [Triplophysa rosa]